MEIDQTIKVCQYYSKQKDALLSQNIKTNAKKKTLIKYQPQGTVYTILPSTYPFLLPFYKCLPQLLLGNGVLVRHSHRRPGIAREVEKIMKKSGFESGEYQHLWNSYEHSENIIKNEQIIGVSFTGTT